MATAHFFYNVSVQHVSLSEIENIAIGQRFLAIFVERGQWKH
jgi:hypothetical protein